MRWIPIWILLLSANSVNSQETINVNTNAVTNNGSDQNAYYTVAGVPFVNKKFTNLVEGTPYLTDYWVKGYILGPHGQRFSGSLLKMDLLNNELHFLNADGIEMISMIDVQELFLDDTIKQISYHLIKAPHDMSKDAAVKWCQLLQKGKLTLYKASYKLLSESLPYGTSTFEQRIHTKNRYYIELNKQIKLVKNSKDLYEYIHDENSEVSEFSKVQKEKKSDEDKLTAIVRYYNSLF